MSIINCQLVSKSFGKVKALERISFDVQPGELFGIIGPDGAGKTTLFRILTTLILADTGTVRVDGKDVVKDFKAIRNEVGYMPGRFSLYQDLTVEENIQFTKDIYGTSIDIAEILEMTALLKYRDIPVGKLPIPLKKMSHFACVLSTDFDLLILEEPSMSFDDDSNQKLIELSKILKNQGKGIAIFTAKKIDLNYCDRVYYIETLEGVN